jgi:hypothetical protein
MRKGEFKGRKGGEEKTEVDRKYEEMEMRNMGSRRKRKNRRNLRRKSKGRRKEARRWSNRNTKSEQKNRIRGEQNVVMSPMGLGNKNHCAGEDQQQFSSQSEENEKKREEGAGRDAIAREENVKHDG